jgi:major type 1 subunit fimbrin (pilin)
MMKRLIPCMLLIGFLPAGTALAQSTARIDFNGSISQSTSCSLTTNNITLPIGDVEKNSFTGVGSTSNWSPNVALISGGCNATQVSMTFTGTADPNNPALFAVQGGAAGVGIQLAQSGGGQFAVPNDTTRPMTFPPAAAGQGYSFAARYQQSGATITAGTANATITVLITYI